MTGKEHGREFSYNKISFALFSKVDIVDIDLESKMAMKSQTTTNNAQ